jgi:hypothetical protein
VFPGDGPPKPARLPARPGLPEPSGAAPDDYP